MSSWFLAEKLIHYLSKPEIRFRMASDDEYDWGQEDIIARQHEATFSTKTDEQLLSVFYKEEPEMKNELKELTEKIEKWKNERKPLIEK